MIKYIKLDDSLLSGDFETLKTALMQSVGGKFMYYYLSNEDFIRIGINTSRAIKDRGLKDTGGLIMREMVSLFGPKKDLARVLRKGYALVEL